VRPCHRRENSPSCSRQLLYTTFWKGADRSVSTVPGCSRMQATFCLRRPNSTAIVFVSWFSAVFEAL
jgi:hypothetical protein